VRPSDCIYTYRRTVGWLRANGYGEHVARLMGQGEDIKTDTPVMILEYMDDTHPVLMAAGHYPYADFYGDTSDYRGLRGVVLEGYENLSDGIPTIIPTRLTLDDMTGQFDNMIGMYFQQAKLMALETIAVEKGIFPDTYLVSRPGELGKFIDGPHDGRSGRVNIIAGGDIREMQTSPGYLTNPTIVRFQPHVGFMDLFGPFASTAAQPAKVEIDVSARLLPHIQSGVPLYLHLDAL
jgi:hypothetical protein